MKTHTLVGAFCAVIVFASTANAGIGTSAGTPKEPLVSMEEKPLKGLHEIHAEGPDLPTPAYIAPTKPAKDKMPWPICVKVCIGLMILMLIAAPISLLRKNRHNSRSYGI